MIVKEIRGGIDKRTNITPHATTWRWCPPWNPYSDIWTPEIFDKVVKHFREDEDDPVLLVKSGTNMYNARPDNVDAFWGINAQESAVRAQNIEAARLAKEKLAATVT